MCNERDSPLKRLYRRTHAKLTRLAGSGQLDWAAGCKLSLALVHARRPAWPGETSETILRVAPPRKTRPPDHTLVNWPVDPSASGSAQVGPGGRHRWAARVQVGQEPARQKAREGYPSHYTSLTQLSPLITTSQITAATITTPNNSTGPTRKVWLHSSQGYPLLSNQIICMC